ncbi:MAG TPA: ADOP family duplicated permease [Bryobacteraceae bacterium]|nr:ADOP family duplicated permease [Bryobacteraceae bacterium]
MWRDVVFGFRQLARYRTTSALVILLLAVGLGANTLVFSLVNELLLKPLPVRNPQNLFLLERNRQLQVRPDTFFSYPLYRDVVLKNPLVAAAVAEQEWYEADQFPMRAGNSVRVVLTQMVSPNYFTELGVRPYAGRLLTESDANASGTLPAVLSYQFWQSEFAGDRAIVGRTIRLKETPFLVVGILPREFHSSDIDRAPDVRLPISASLLLRGKSVDEGGGDGLPTFRLLLRLAPGVSGERAAAALLPPMQALEQWSTDQFYARHKELAATRNRAWEQDRLHGYRLAAVPIGHGASQLRDQFARALGLLLGGVALLLVAVCANVAGLLLAKSNQRRKEMGIRLAVGAGRWQLMRQLLTEHLLLAVAAGALGAGLAYALSPALVGLLPAPRDYAQLGSPLILTISPDARVLAFLGLLTLLCVLAFGLLPAWRTSRVSLAAELKIARGQAPAGRGALTPIALQVAFSVVLLSAAGLMLRTFWNLEHLDAGFDRGHVIEMTPDPDALGYTAPQISALYGTLRDKVAALPGVASAALASRGVMRGVGIKMTLAPEGVSLPASTFLNTSGNNVSPEYFATMGIPVLAGRDLTIEDAGRKPLPAVVNRAFAESFFPDQDPIGKMLVQGTDGKQPPGFVIVGLVATAKYRSLREPDPPTIYTPLAESATPGGSLLYVRTHGAPAGMAGALRQTLASLDPAVPVREILTLDSEVETSLWQERLVAILSAFFGGAAALLAGIGLYGSLALSVEQRRREIGIRVAIGARLVHILRALCGPIAVAVGLGAAAGLTASAFLLRLTERLLYGVRPFDPLSLVLAMVFVCLCAAAAAFPPARRAGRIDPASALREE